eukprot:Protomagalhaensia_wolfi_Nauph_80__1239@NODE_1730_length_1374_cov_6_216479_g1345_i0_p2_GENE_NODE_1730_length_1374_cov_6_216479_g1345_i0NODE_1730_length_1374_cov_6_216479_g1345_i0_p2_ORF_typecomplete_len195_score29_56_NODE_1730_length_1374_cov_6_216479_g1345_i07891292
MTNPFTVSGFLVAEAFMALLLSKDQDQPPYWSDLLDTWKKGHPKAVMAQLISARIKGVLKTHEKIHAIDSLRDLERFAYAKGHFMPDFKFQETVYKLPSNPPRDLGAWDLLVMAAINDMGGWGAAVAVQKDLEYWKIRSSPAFYKLGNLCEERPEYARYIDYDYLGL